MGEDPLDEEARRERAHHHLVGSVRVCRQVRPAEELVKGPQVDLLVHHDQGPAPTKHDRQEDRHVLRAERTELEGVRVSVRGCSMETRGNSP